MVAMLVVCLVLGCGRQLPPGIYIGNSSRTIEALAENDVIFRVNGEKITKRDFLDVQRLEDRLYRLQNKISFDEKNARAEREVKANEQRVPERLMREVLIRQEAERIGINLTRDEVEKHAASVLANLKMRDLGVAGASGKIGGRAGEYFTRLLKAEILQERLLQLPSSRDALTVTAQEISNRVEFVKTFNANAEKMNRLAREKLLAAKKEILAGAKFRDVARKCAEVHPEYGEKWTTLELAELVGDLEQELKAWLKTAKVGDISDPIDLDDGIAIVGLLAKGEGEVPANMEVPMLYSLVRCTLYARESLPDKTPAEAEKTVAEWKREEALKALGKRLMDGAAIEFPNGTNFFARVEEKRDKQFITPSKTAKEEK